jgi:hypothetical protein
MISWSTPDRVYYHCSKHPGVLVAGLAKMPCYESHPIEPQDCPKCKRQPELLHASIRGVYYYKCAPGCLCGPSTDTLEEACIEWNRLDYKKEEEE